MGQTVLYCIYLHIESGSAIDSFMPVIIAIWNRLFLPGNSIIIISVKQIFPRSSLLLQNQSTYGLIDRVPWGLFFKLSSVRDSWTVSARLSRSWIKLDDVRHGVVSNALRTGQKYI